MRGRAVTTELEVTEYVPNRSVRLVADTNGTIWDSVFTVQREGEGTNLTLRMEARAYKFLPTILNMLALKSVTRALQKDMEAVKAYCE
jgi:hypothetical protein